MLTFLSLHGGEILVCLILLLIVGAIIARMVRDRRAGKGGFDGAMPLAAGILPARL